LDETKEYIRIRIDDAENLVHTVRNAFDNRSKADYALKPSISEKDIKASLRKAKEFIIFSKNYFKIEQG